MLNVRPPSLNLKRDQARRQQRQKDMQNILARRDEATRNKEPVKPTYDRAVSPNLPKETTGDQRSNTRDALLSNIENTKTQAPAANQNYPPAPTQDRELKSATPPKTQAPAPTRVKDAFDNVDTRKKERENDRER